MNPVVQEAMENRIKEIDALVQPLQVERINLKQKLLEYQSPFKVGDVIVWAAGSKRGVVSEIGEFCQSPMWVVKRILKGGLFGAECNVRFYDNPVLEPQEL